MLKFLRIWRERRALRRRIQQRVCLAVRCVETGGLIPMNGRLTGARDSEE